VVRLERARDGAAGMGCIIGVSTSTNRGRQEAADGLDDRERSRKMRRASSFDDGST